jgi:flagellar biosynthesis protein FlhG
MLLLDADPGLANVDIQLALMPARDLGGVIAGRATLREVVSRHAEGGFNILPGRSGSGGCPASNPPHSSACLPRCAMRQPATKWCCSIVAPGWIARYATCPLSPTRRWWW